MVKSDPAISCEVFDAEDRYWLDPLSATLPPSALKSALVVVPAFVQYRTVPLAT
jgi:hypothetical protein